MSVFGITLLSIKRRMPQIIKAACTTLAAVFFVTAVLIFQENMYQWQMSSNKSRFGDWFICEVTSKEPNNSLSEHAYLNAPVKAVTCVDMFNKDWKMTGYILGSFDEAFVKQGRLKLNAGHLPQEDDEIAMDWNTLLSLGYTGEIGETITIRYCEENSVYNNEARHEKQFRLSGIFANYTSIWKYGKKMPGAVVTENALSAFNTKCKNSYLYSLKESVRASDYAIVYKKIKEDAKTETEYNSAVYDYQPWNSAAVYAYMYIVVMVMSNSRDTPITDYGYRYIFSTEYVNPTKELYKKLEKYIDKEYRNYDDFVNGRQVVVFLQDAPDGSYDDTLKAGDTLNYNYYELPVDASFHVPMSIADGRYVYPYDKAFFDKYNNSGKIDLHAHYYGSGGNMAGGTGTENPVREQVIDGYEVLFGACVSPTVAAVIKVTDDVREDFNGIMVDYGYYTALAGMSLAQQAVDNQRNLMERMTGDEMTGDLEFGLHYNQLSVQYDLSSAFSATNNKLSVYFENNDLVYNSNVDAKNIYRTQLINNILQYGITIAASVVIQLLIMAIIVRNRIERRKEKYKLLHGLGMRRGTIVKICMLEALRESVWCIFTMPLILIMELLMYTRKNLVE